MKKYLIYLSLIIHSSLAISQNHEKEFISFNHVEKQAKDQYIVYVCTGNYAYAYHSRSNCPGLNNCQGQTISTYESNATSYYNRVPCCICWSNVSERCHNDNQGAGYGGDGDAYLYMALAIVATGAIIISNDFYIYPTYSVYDKVLNDNAQYNEYSSGWCFGLRKTFRNSALEYGASYLEAEERSLTTGKIPNRWGGHLNFIHHIFYNQTAPWLKFYLGGTVNYIDNTKSTGLFETGYGGIGGVNFRVFDRLKFDIRYEWTTLTSQAQAGIIFKYQKKYFWQ